MPSQVVSLFASATAPRLRRFLLLNHRPGGLPEELSIAGAAPSPARSSTFSTCDIVTLKEEVARDAAYVYREGEARLTINGNPFNLRLGLLPNQHADSSDPAHYSWWQWCRAERLWSGELAEAWRIGGHLVPYTIDAPGQWTSPGISRTRRHAQRISAATSSTATSTSSPGKPVSCSSPSISNPRTSTPGPSRCRRFRSSRSPTDCNSTSAHRVRCSVGRTFFPPSVVIDGMMVVQPWKDLRLLANKTREGKLIYLPPEKARCFPRRHLAHIAVQRRASPVPAARMSRDTKSSPRGTQRCGVIETAAAGPAADLGERNADADSRGNPAGRHRHRSRLARSQPLRRLPRPEEDGAEWEGNLAQGMFNLAYQRGDSDPIHWRCISITPITPPTFRSITAPGWAGWNAPPRSPRRCRSSASAALSTAILKPAIPICSSSPAPSPASTWRWNGRSEPRSCIGRDAYPIANLMALWDYDPQPLYLDFAKQMITRLLSTQQPDGGFSTQAGAGVLTGVSCRAGVRDIHFGRAFCLPSRSSNGPRAITAGPMTCSAPAPLGGPDALAPKGRWPLVCRGQIQ